MLFITSVVGLQGYTPVTAQTNVQISDVQVPDEVSQASSGQVQATVENLLNISMDGFARFTDEWEQIRSYSPIDPLIDLVNFTIGPYETKTVVVDYTVNATATLGVHTATFEVNVGGFAFLLEQYPITVISVARIIDVVPGSVFSHNQPGLLLISIENRGDLTQSVRIEVFGSKFINVSEEIDLAPGTNTVAIPLMPNASHVYDFGMFQANVSMYYFDEIISSEVVTIPVDMSLLNKALAVILPVSIFLILVLFYIFRRRQRLRAAEASE
jgi:hypothetical protein